MPINEGFHLAHPLPLAPDVPIEQQEIGNARDEAVASSRVLKLSALITTVAAIAIAVAVLSARDTVTPDVDVTASLAGNSKLQPDADQSAPETQSTVGATALVQPAADPQVAPPTAKDVPAREEIAASEPAGRDQAEASAPASETLFKQFQAWAAEQDVRPNYRPLVEDVPAQAEKKVAGNAPAPNRLVQKRRYIRPVQNARAEARPENVRKKKVRRAPVAGVARSPAEEVRTQGQAQSQSVQDAQASSFLPAFGLRN
jgi:hypothetical protein